MAGKLDDTVGAEVTQYDPTQWGFRVMAINSVVERNAEDGTISEDGITGDGIWSNVIRVNKDQRPS